MADQIEIQGKWQFCDKCGCLWWAGSSFHGVCPAGGSHNTDPGSSYDYQVLYTKGSPYHG